VLLAACALAACRTSPDVRPTAAGGPPVAIYIVKRSWHIDIGFDAADLHPPLATLRAALPNARYLLFGFGDKHYLLSHGRSFDRLLGAVWPGEALVLLTGIEGTPEEVFGTSEVIRLSVNLTQAIDLQEFVWNTLATENGVATALAPGPYAGSFYYGSVQRYSGLHTCNTWAAEALRSAAIPVHSYAVVFSGQLWRQVRRIKRHEKSLTQPDDGAPVKRRVAPLRPSVESPSGRSQGGLVGRREALHATM
jgi:Protein of unknown function (DUF2459)